VDCTRGVKLHGFEAFGLNSVVSVTQPVVNFVLSACYKKASFHDSCFRFQRLVAAKTAFDANLKHRECEKLWANQSPCHSSTDFPGAAKATGLPLKDCDYVCALNCSHCRIKGGLTVIEQSFKANFSCLVIKKDLCRDFELLDVVSACFPLISPKLI
jgi:hypothetical protein